MAEKDIREKILMRHADVFADCMNALIYGGERKVTAGDLQPAPTESFYNGKHGMRNQFCDVSFYFMKEGKVKLQFIVENETQPRRRLILRNISYHGGAYRQQLETGKAVYPVASIVLDWKRRGDSPDGGETERKGARIPLSLHELLFQEGTEQSELELVEDVHLNICHMESLTEEVRNRFVSDMGFVVDYLSEGSFEKRKDQEILHAEALCGMMEALTGDTRFTEMMEELLERQEEGGRMIMCEYIDMLEARGEARGKEIGKEIGENNLARLLSQLYSQGREEDAKLAVRDAEARKEMYREFCIA